MKLLADEGVDKPIVTALINADFDVSYILETHQGAEDEMVLQIANSQNRILLTQDKDFGELVFRLKRAHPGIILIRLDGNFPSQKAQIIIEILSTHEAELANAFTVIQPNAVRIRK